MEAWQRATCIHAACTTTDMPPKGRNVPIAVVQCSSAWTETHQSVML